MIVRRTPGLVLMDREALSVWLHRPQGTIRRHCLPLACDVQTHRTLYDADACVEIHSRLGVGHRGPRNRRVLVSDNDP